MKNETMNTQTNCSQCQTDHYGLKAVCYDHLTAFEAVTMSVVAVLSVTLGTIWATV